MKNYATVVKIDFCKSKLFARERETVDPTIRSTAIKKLMEIASNRFPYGDKHLPEGSFYKQEGDAVYFILEKNTVAIRSAIEFMKEWYHEGLKREFPECRVIIHSGRIETVTTPGGEDYLGKVFEDISVIEKQVGDGKIFVSEHTRKNADLTITKFVFFGNRQMAPGEKIALYYLAFSDPRTFENDSLAHLLFIAHKESAEMRERIFSLFLVKYLLEESSLSDLAYFERWCRSKIYPVIPRQTTTSLLKNADLFLKGTVNGVATYVLHSEKRIELEGARSKYDQGVIDAVDTVSDEISRTLGTRSAIEGLDLRKIMDEYLCGIFSEIRMVANYFRDTASFYESDERMFSRYNYISDRYLEDIPDEVAQRWKIAFIVGLKKLAEKQSVYIAAIFHNILAGYYLNRSFHASSYQIEKLQKRLLVLDTNVLYALRCASSNYHEKVKYFVDRVTAIGVRFGLYPFTVTEFEASLERVSREYNKNPNSPKLIAWNPWLYQEFRRHPHVYLNSMDVCRTIYSVAKNRPVTVDNYAAIQEELLKNGVLLEQEFECFSEEETKELWSELRSSMLKPGDMVEYWHFSDKLDRPGDTIVEHDVNLMENVRQEYVERGEDDFGPLVLLITLDSKLLRCRKDYPFVISAEQFLEFMMPYLFLAEIPEMDPNGFPNQILSAHLGVYTTFWKPDNKDVLSMFFSDPTSIGNQALGSNVGLIARTLSMDRLGEVVKRSACLADLEKEKVISQLAEKVDEAVIRNNERAFESRKLKILEQQLEFERTEKEKFMKESEKLRKTVSTTAHYFLDTHE